MNSLANRFEPSSREAACDGARQSKPLASNASLIPATKGASGPTTVKSIDWLPAKAVSASKSMTPMATFSHLASSAVPGLPGATNTRSTDDDSANFHANACSRPPLPITKILMTLPLTPAVLPWTFESSTLFSVHAVAVYLYPPVQRLIKDNLKPMNLILALRV